VLGITHGKSGVVMLLRRMVQWRVGLRWYAVAFLLPVAIAITVAAQPVVGRAGSLVDRAKQLDKSLLHVLASPARPRHRWSMGGAGRRGYALPRLQVGRSALSASLILWAGLVVWHLPLFLVGRIHWSDIVFLMGFVVIFNWIFNSTGGSVLILMLTHAMNNTMSGSFVGPLFSGVDSVRQAWFSPAPHHLQRSGGRLERPRLAAPPTARPRCAQAHRHRFLAGIEHGDSIEHDLHRSSLAA
jgi:hypothetical protein